MRKTLLLCFICCLFTCFYQQVHSQSTGKPLFFRQLIFSTSALEYLPNKLNCANLNLGAEYPLSAGNTAYLNAGYITSYGPSKAKWMISSESTKGYKVQLEGRHYFDRQKIFGPAILIFWPHILQFNTVKLPNTGYYVALQGSMQSTSTRRNETLDNVNIDNPTLNYFQRIRNSYKVKRSVIGLNLKLGYQCIKKYGLVIDYAVGVGAQYIMSRSEDKLGTNSENDIPWNSNFDGSSGFHPSILYQVRIGWTR